MTFKRFKEKFDIPLRIFFGLLIFAIILILGTIIVVVPGAFFIYLLLCGLICLLASIL
jgi:hypothetical protein